MGERPDLADVVWRKSTFSGAPDKTCVEVASLTQGGVAVRDSKDPNGPVLVFTDAEWIAFVRAIRAGELG
jgi:Domain of unknown function (DUF397)